MTQYFPKPTGKPPNEIMIGFLLRPETSDSFISLILLRTQLIFAIGYSFDL